MENIRSEKLLLTKKIEDELQSHPTDQVVVKRNEIKSRLNTLLATKYKHKLVEKPTVWLN